MWQNWQQRRIFLAISGLSSLVFAIFLVITFWPTPPNQFNTNPLRPGYRSAKLPAARILVEAQTTGSPRFTLSRDDSQFEFRVPGENTVLTNSDSNSLTFRNTLNQEIRYQIQSNGIKEEIKLFDKTKENTFSTQIRVNNVSVKVAPNGALYFYSQDGEYQFHVEAPFAQDATGNTTWGVSYQILDEKGTPLLLSFDKQVSKDLLSYQTIELHEGYELQVVVNPEWLQAEERQYPIIIDPTVVHDTSSEFASGSFSKNRDTGSGSSPSIEAAYPELAADEHTVGLWHMNEGTDNTCAGGQDLCDSSGNGLHATFTGNAAFTTTRQVGAAASTYDGTGDYAEIPDSSLFDFGTGDFSVELWAKADTLAGYNTYAELGSYGPSILIRQDSTTTLSAYIMGTAISQTYTPPLNTWYHVAVIRKSGVVRFYINGAQVGTDTAYSGSIAVVGVNRFGSSVHTTGQYFDGNLDDIRISNVARSPEELLATAAVSPSSTYTSPVIDLTSAASLDSLAWTENGVSTGDGETLASATNLVAQWNLNNTSGTTATNNAGSCGATCNGTLTGFASTGSQDAAAGTGWTSANARWGNGALMFDGSDDRVSAGNPAALQITGSLTLEAWVKAPSRAASYHGVIGKMGTGSGQYGYALRVYDNKVNFGISTTGSDWYSTVGTTNVADGQWHHVVGVFTSSSKFEIFVDGKLDYLASSAPANIYNTPGAAIIGATYSTPSELFPGSIDSARIYSRALTASEIAANAQAGNIQFQTRSSADGSTWEAWKPTTSETQLLSLDNDATNTLWSQSNEANPAGETIAFTSTNISAANAYTYWQIANNATVMATGDTIEYDTYMVGGSGANVAPAMDVRFTDSSYLRSDGGSVDQNGWSAHFTGPAYVENRWWHRKITVSSAINGKTVSWFMVVNEEDTGTTVNAYYDNIVIRNSAGAIKSVIYTSGSPGLNTLDLESNASNTGVVVMGLAPQGGNTQIANSTFPAIQGSGSLRINSGPVAPDPATTALWRFEETGGTGAYIKDSSGNGLHGTPSGTTVAEGVSGKSRDFTSSAIAIPTTSLPTGNQISISFWAYGGSSLPAATSIIYGNDASTNRVINIHLPWTDGTVFWDAGNSGTASYDRISKMADASDYKGRWTYWTFTKNATTGSMKIYLDGVLWHSGTGMTRTLSASATSALGSYPGKLDEFQISNVERSATEVAEAYRLGRERYLNRTISSTDLSTNTTLPFSVAADRPGTYLQATVGESAFANYQTDSSTVGLWHLEEQTGSGAFIKDDSGWNASGTPTGSTSITGKFGQGRSFNGSSDYLTTGNIPGLATGNTAHSIDAWIKPNALPTTRQWPLLLGNAGSGNHHWLWDSSGNMALGVWGTNSCYIRPTVGVWNYVAATFDGTTLRCYLNGQLISSTAATFNLAGISLKLAQAQISEAYFNGSLDEVRVSSGARSAAAIRQTFEIDSRSFPITVEFGASLDSGNLISGSGDTSFTINATTRGLNKKGSKIYADEKIIIRENYNGTEYIAQSTVNTVNETTGAITVAAWDSGSTFPSGGFTTNADVFKWQREYWDPGGIFDSHIDATTLLSFRFTDSNEGRSVWLDDMRTAGDYLTNATSSTITSTPQRYFQYRAVSSSNAVASPALSSVTLNYTQDVVPNTPTFEATSIVDKVKSKDSTPVVSFSATHTTSSDLVYEVQWDTSHTFPAPSSATSNVNAGFANLDNGGDTSPFTSGDSIAYTWQSALTNGQTYFYRVRAQKSGDTTWGAWSTIRSLTIDTSLANDGWFETHAGQFASDTAEPNVLVDATGNYVYIDPTGAPAFSRPITITNSGSTLTNHHTLLTIDTAALISASKVQADCDDLRFYDVNDTQLVYWIENGCNTSTTKIWVQIPSLPNGNTDITMYYGDATAVAGGQSYSGSMMAGFDGSCPGGWSAVSALNSGNYYIRGGTGTVGTLGGITTHAHSVSLSTGGPSSTEGTHGGGWPGSSVSHTHATTVTSGSGNNDPPYYNVVFCQASGMPISQDTSMLGLFPSLPSGWTRFTALDNRFPRGSSTAGGTGGNATHTHTISGTFGGGATTGVDESQSAGDYVARGDHTHTFSTTSQPASSLPAYQTMIYAKPNSASALVEGQIALINTNVPPPLGWTRYTALDNKFPYGGATTGTIGGSDTHAHSVSAFGTNSASGQINLDDYATDVATQNHSHTVNATNTTSSSTLPPYYTVSFYQRKTDATTKSVGAEVSSLRRLFMSTPIEATKITTSRWNQFSFTDTTTFGNISYRLYYDNVGTPTLVPDSDLAGNSAGFGTSPIDLSTLSTTEYPILYIGADILYSNGTPQLLDWQITFNEPPETPTLLAPPNGNDLTSLSPVFQLTTTDDESDYVRYKIEMCKDAAMTLWCETFDQTVSQTNWSGQNAQTSTAYNSGSTATYTYPTQLPINTTYYWRAYAIDPGGADWWSGTQSPVWSFSTPNLVRPQMCLLEESPDDDSLIIKWDDPNIVETGYEIERDLSAAGFSSYLTTAANVTTTTDNTVSANNSYQYRVRAVLGASITDWCTTPLLQIETGHLLLDGVRGEGLELN